MCEKSILDAAELGQSLCFVGQGELDLGEVVLNFYIASCKVNEIIGDGTNLCIEAFVGVFVEIG